MTKPIRSPEGIRKINYPPRRGEHYLSVNLAIAKNVLQLCTISTELEFTPEVVQLVRRRVEHDAIEIHILLFYEHIEESDTFTNIFW